MRLPSAPSSTIASDARASRYALDLSLALPEAAPVTITSTLLVIDDSKAIRSTTRDLLLMEGDLAVIEATDGLTGFRLLLEKTPDLVLCDLEMPIADGRKFLALRKSRPEVADLPVIMLTADHDSERKADLLDLGAADYVTKPFHPRELLSRVRVQLRLRQLSAELRAVNDTLKAITVTDPLTGLANRRRLDETLVTEVARAKRYGTPLSLAMLDVDHFKKVNDTWGHDAGDEVLRGLARTLGQGVRRTDLASRLGGEEFVVLMPHTPLNGASDVAERLRTAFAKTPFAIGQAEVGCSVSIGVTTLDASKGIDDGQKLLKAADVALYAAKSGGRNRVVLG